jgi:hypothetical protein
MSMDALINTQTIIDNFNRRGDELPEKLQKFVTEVSFIVQGNIQDEAPVVTGNLQGSIRRESLGSFMYRIFPDEGIAPYAYFILKGTEPHEIWAKPGSALNTPHGLFRKVNHPGTEANPFFDRGVQNSQADIDAEVELFTSWLTGETDDY